MVKCKVLKKILGNFCCKDDRYFKEMRSEKISSTAQKHEKKSRKKVKKLRKIGQGQGASISSFMSEVLILEGTLGTRVHLCPS